MSEKTTKKRGRKPKNTEVDEIAAFEDVDMTNSGYTRKISFKIAGQTATGAYNAEKIAPEVFVVEEFPASGDPAKQRDGLIALITTSFVKLKSEIGDVLNVAQKEEITKRLQAIKKREDLLESETKAKVDELLKAEKEKLNSQFKEHMANKEKELMDKYKVNAKSQEITKQPGQETPKPQKQVQPKLPVASDVVYQCGICRKEISKEQYEITKDSTLGLPQCDKCMPTGLTPQ